MCSIEPGRWRKRDKELGTIGVGTAIRHGDDTSTNMFQVTSNFIGKVTAITYQFILFNMMLFIPIDRFTASARARGVATLYDILLVSFIVHSGVYIPCLF